MKQVWKKRAVVVSVLLLVCAAVYLNWRYTGGVADTSKVLGQSTLVSGTQEGEDAQQPSTMARRHRRRTTTSPPRA